MTNIEKYKLVKASGIDKRPKDFEAPWVIRPKLSTSEGLTKLLSYGALGAIPGALYSALVNPEEEIDPKTKKKKKRDTKDRVLRTLKNSLITALPTMAGATVGDEELRYKYISPLVGRIVSNVVWPFTYSGGKLDKALDNPKAALKSIIDDVPLWERVDYGVNMKPETIAARRALVRAGFGIDLSAADWKKVGLKPVSDYEVTYDKNTEWGNKQLSELRNDFINNAVSTYQENTKPGIKFLSNSFIPANELLMGGFSVKKEITPDSITYKANDPWDFELDGKDKIKTTDLIAKAIRDYNKKEKREIQQNAIKLFRQTADNLMRPYSIVLNEKIPKSELLTQLNNDAQSEI